MDTKWREILEQVERGELTPEQGAELLAAQTRQLATPTRQFESAAAQPAPPAESPAPARADAAAPGFAPPAAPPEPEVVEDYQNVLASWKNWWMIPLWVGVLICVLSGLAMSSAAAAGHMFWFYCAILPALLGAFAVVASFWSRKSRWVHVRVRETGGKNIAISLPVPTELVGWVLHTFGGQIPGLREQPEVVRAMPEMLKAVQESSEPLVVEVNDKDGSEVRVYIL